VEGSSHFDPTLAAVDYRVPGIIARINYLCYSKFSMKMKITVKNIDFGY
jgi:hypothetical protein